MNTAMTRKSLRVALRRLAYDYQAKVRGQETFAHFKQDESVFRRRRRSNCKRRAANVSHPAVVLGFFMVVVVWLGLDSHAQVILGDF